MDYLVIYYDNTGAQLPVRFSNIKDAKKFVTNLVNDGIDEDSIIVISGNAIDVMEVYPRKTVVFRKVPEKDMAAELVNTDDEEVSDEDIDKLLETTVPLRKK